MAVGVRVRRRGRGGDGPVAGLLRPVVISPRDGVVGGRSVLKQRFAVHHLTRRNAPFTTRLVPSSQLRSSATERIRTDLRLLGLCCPENRGTLIHTQRRRKQRKQRKDAAQKRKLRLYPCANFVPGGATTPPKKRSTLTPGMIRVRLTAVNSAPFPPLRLVLRYQSNSELSSQRLISQLEVTEAFAFCLDCHKRRIM